MSRGGGGGSGSRGGGGRSFGSSGRGGSSSNGNSGGGAGLIVIIKLLFYLADELSYLLAIPIEYLQFKINDRLGVYNEFADNVVQHKRDEDFENLRIILKCLILGISTILFIYWCATYQY